MEASWTSQLIGRTVEDIEQREGCPCVVRLAGGYRLQIESLWRLLSSGAVALTSEDEGQLFGGSQPLRAIPELSSKLHGQTLVSCQATPGTADLTLNFGQSVLQVITDSSGYEAWQVEGPAGTLAVGQGGGNVVVWY
ncbi:DUF6188 family protein [Dyella agri]|uniref:Uncharacterized protein n=1 Tax=Dyella agri TaxID=1926869 RepID=A0ABW8KCZ9_9GAMM